MMNAKSDLASPSAASVDRSSSETAIPAGIVKNGDRICKPYFGAKSGEGVWQTILNNIPPHEVFYELFAGSATITRHKRPARTSIVVDSDPAVVKQLKQSTLLGQCFPSVQCTDAISWLEMWLHNNTPFNGMRLFKTDTVFYLDPPYLFDVRTTGRRPRYKQEFGEPDQHRRLLTLLNTITARTHPYILISGYRSALYDELLASWRRVDYRCSTRGGPRTESLWCNFPEPKELHDYQVAGRDFRERERIKRKRERWKRRLSAMPPIERAIILEACLAISGEGGLTPA